jgi:hypothetical protein
MNQKTIVICLSALLFSTSLAVPVQAAGGTCEWLNSLSLPNTTITLAETVAAGAFGPPAGRQGRVGAVFADTPSFCRVAAPAPSAFGHQDSLVAFVRVERQISGGRQRRLGWRHFVSCAGASRVGWWCGRRHRHWPHNSGTFAPDILRR